jgi:hypothetical protein
VWGRGDLPQDVEVRFGAQQLACTELLLQNDCYCLYTPFTSLSYPSGLSIFGFVLLNLSGTGDKLQPRVEGETLRTIVLVGRTLSSAESRLSLYVHEVLLIDFIMEGYHLQSSLRARGGIPIPSSSAIKHALLLPPAARLEPTKVEQALSEAIANTPTQHQPTPRLCDP